MSEVICIVCPIGCHLQVDEQNGYAVTGHSCPRGEAYGKDEITNPLRMITSTVRVSGTSHRRCPVKTAQAIPKGLITQAVRLLDQVDLAAPVVTGQIVIKDICGTGIPFVATRSLPLVNTLP